MRQMGEISHKPRSAREGMLERGVGLLGKERDDTESSYNSGASDVRFTVTFL